jgi:hypothetical protein
MDAEVLKEIVRNHALWLTGNSGGECADLSDADLRDADLRDANLSGADLCGANLSGTNLSGADLRDADLSGTNLSGADLRGASLRGTNLRGANLRGTNLRGANLCDANLCDANLRGANLCDANLCVIQTDIWTIYVHAESVRIGCKHFTHKEWLSFDDSAIGDMDSRALAWWRIWKPVVSAAIDAITYTITHR